MNTEKEDVEVKLLLSAIKLQYGYDFTKYAKASITRRIKKGLNDSGEKTISALIPRIIHDKPFFDRFIFNLSVNVTEMFRDPLVYKKIREKVIPYLKTFPYIKIWSAGVATGEEVYSLAILLKEEGLYDKSIIYATDFNDEVLDTAKKGIYTLESIKKSTVNYQTAGGEESFGNYYHADYDSVIIDRKLKKNIVFANHNLVSDSVFGEMNLILCRNVLIYFNSNLQNHVLNLFKDSLSNNGFLCLGTKETIDFSNVKNAFVPIEKKQKIYQKKLKKSESVEK